MHAEPWVLVRTDDGSTTICLTPNHYISTFCYIMTHLKHSKTDSTTSSASSLGSLPVTLPILQVVKKRNKS